MPGYLTVAGVAAVVTFLLTFVMRRVAPRIGAIAMPGPRSIHTKPTPSLGGAAMFVGFLVAMAVASRLGQFREIFADVLSRPGRKVTYCGVGIAATSDALALSLLGESDVAVYDGSLQEWTSNPELPVEIG